MLDDTGQIFADAIAVADRVLDRLPLEAVTVTAAGRAWTIDAVRDQDRLLSAAEGLAIFPFGLLLWESAVVLADVLADGSVDGWEEGRAAGGTISGALSGMTVLELGAGTGLAGLAAAALGARVVQTDHSAEALALCRRNQRSNGVSGLDQRFGDWIAWHDPSRYDLVIGADILYEPSLHRDLARVLDMTIAPGRPVILTDPARTCTSQFILDLELAGWQVGRTAHRVPSLAPARPGETVRVDVIVARKWPRTG